MMFLLMVFAVSLVEVSSTRGRALQAGAVLEEIIRHRNIENRPVVDNNWKETKSKNGKDTVPVGQHAVLYIPQTGVPFQPSTYYDRGKSMGHNYAAATIVKDNKHNRITPASFHTEDYLVDQWDNLIRKYQETSEKKNKKKGNRRGSRKMFPEIMYFYSFLSPCQRCSNRIIQRVREFSNRNGYFKVILSWDIPYGTGANDETIKYCQHYKALEGFLNTRKIHLVHYLQGFHSKNYRADWLQHRMFDCIKNIHAINLLAPDLRSHLRNVAILINKLTWLCVTDTNSCNTGRGNGVRNPNCWEEKMKKMNSMNRNAISEVKKCAVKILYGGGVQLSAPLDEDNPTSDIVYIDSLENLRGENDFTLKIKRSNKKLRGKFG